MSCVAIVVAAGSGERMNIGKNKLLCEIDGVTVIERTLSAFEQSPYIDAIVLVIGQSDSLVPYAKRFSKVKSIVRGGSSRSESVLNALSYTEGFEMVAVHDGDRPFVSQKIIEDTVSAAKKTGAAVPCISVTDTIKYVEEGIIKETPKRSTLRAAQTPQVFKRELLLKGYEGSLDGATDDSSLVEKIHPVTAVCSSEDNIKLTVQSDLAHGEIIARRQRSEKL